MIVGVGSGFGVGASYTQTAGATTVDGMLKAPSGFTLSKDTLVGSGTIVGNLTSSASVTAGDSATKPAIMTVGTYTQNPAGLLNISIGGSTVGTKYSRLAVSNGASLGGTLTVKRINNFKPAIGNIFTIVTGTAITGTFATVNGLSINSSEHFQINYGSTAVTLSVVAGP
jgi:hypothetical protein